MSDSVNNDLCIQVELLLSDRKQMRKLKTFTARILKIKTNYNFARPYCADDIINIVVEKIYSGKYNFNDSYCTLIACCFIRIRPVIANIITDEKPFIPAKIKEGDSDFIDFDSD